MSESLLPRIADGRTDLVFDYVAAGHAATSVDSGGMSLVRWCAHHGDVSAIKFLLSRGESLQSLGDNYDLNGAVFLGDSALTWASWHLRPRPILKKLCYGRFRA